MIPTLAVRLLTRKLAHTLILLLPLAAVGVASTTLLALEHNFKASVEHQVQADAAMRGRTFLPVDSNGQAALDDAVGVVRIFESTAKISCSGRLVEVAVRSAGSSSQLPGTVLRGRMPNGPGEIALTTSPLDSLRCALGDGVSLDDEPATIVGILASPADANQQLAVKLGADVKASTATYVSDDSYAEIPSLRVRDLSSSFVERSVVEISERQADDEWRRQMPMGVGGFIWPASACIAVFAVWAYLLAQRKNLHALSEIGFSERQRRATALWTVLAGGLSGWLLGSSLSLLSIALLPQLGEQLFSQQWINVRIPFEQLLIASVAGAFFLGASAFATLSVGRVHGPIRTIRLQVIVVSGLSTSLVVLILASTGVLPVRVASGAGLGAALSGCAALHLLLSGRRQGSLQRIRTNLRTGFVFLAALVSGVAMVASFQSAYTAHGVLFSSSASGALQPPGSAYIDTIPTATSDRIFDGENWPHAVRISIPNERDGIFRVASPGFADCAITPTGHIEVGQDVSGCASDRSRAPLNGIGILNGSVIRADPTLIEDGLVAILEIDGASGRVVNTWMRPAVADTSLGGLVPGLVVDERTASEFGIRDWSTAESVLVPDFLASPPDAKAQLRGDLARVSPASVFREDNGMAEFLGEVARTRFIALVGSLLVLLFGIAGGCSLVIASRRAYADMLILGLTARRLLSWSAGNSLYLAGAVILGTLIGRWCAWIEGIHDGSGFGTMWLLPGAAGLIAAGVTVAFSARIVIGVGLDLRRGEVL